MRDKSTIYKFSLIKQIQIIIIFMPPHKFKRLSENVINFVYEKY